MKNLAGLMKQASQMQSKMQEMQEELGRVEVEGTSGGGLVTVRMTAKMEVKAVKTPPRPPTATIYSERRGSIHG